MEGETSQAIVSGGIFDGEPDLDWSEDTSTEGTETEAPSADAQKPKEEGADEQQASDDVADFLTVKYNKADRKLSKKEAVEYAQKGMNYDHVKEELESYRNGPIGKAMKAYADQAGMSVEKYAELMAQQAEAAAEKKAIAELQEEHPDWPEDAVAEYAKLKREGTKAQAKSAEDEKLQREWAEALARFPEITPDAIPQDVHDAVANGASPLLALLEHKTAEQAAKIAELTSAQEKRKTQAENRARSIGPAAGVSSGGEAEDDFLAGMSMRARGY